jgi:hypothetical protein
VASSTPDQRNHVSCRTSSASAAEPSNCADAAWQNRVTDEEIRDLEGKPELDELIALIRSFSGA